MKGVITAFLFLLVLVGTVVGDQGSTESHQSYNGFDLTSLTLRELTDIKVITVSKKNETMLKSASAVYVITQEDIRRSGASTIPDILRMAPGIQVGQANTEMWGISARGLTSIMTDTLLVMIDGRTILSPAVSATFWGEHDLILEDIERIEIVRGPGSAVWDSNAVNGIINIITKKNHHTRGGLMVTEVNKDEATGSLRYGEKLADGVYYRTYVKAFDRDRLKGSGPGFIPPSDNWRSVLWGGRIDWEPSKDEFACVESSLHYKEHLGSFHRYSLDPIAAWEQKDTMTSLGFFIRGERTRKLENDRELYSHFYYDFTDLDHLVVTHDQHIVHIDTILRQKFLEIHMLSAGLGYRIVRDDFEDEPDSDVQPGSSTRQLISPFIQDEVSLLDGKLIITAGSKFEYNDYTGFEVQPSLRAIALPANRQSVWAAVSRAVKNPSREEFDAEWFTLTEATADKPAEIIINTSANDDTLSVVAYEAGYRIQPHNRLWLDTAVFLNDYDNIETYESDSERNVESTLYSDIPSAISTDYTSSTIERKKNLKGTTMGCEMAAKWQVNRMWTMLASYAYLDIDLDLKDGSTAQDSLNFWERSSPQHQFSFISRFDPHPDIEFDIWIRFVDELPARGTDSYLTGDARVAWTPRKDFEISLVGRNILFDADHSEFEFYEVEQTVTAKAVWYF